MEIVKEEGGVIVTIIVAEYDKRRIHVIGRTGSVENVGGLRPYEAFLVIGEEWTDGYEIEVSHDFESELRDHDEWTEEIEFLLPQILWGEKQEYETIITDKHRELVVHLE